MIDRDNIIQPSDQVVDIAHWPVHEEYEVYPEGARVKTLRVCPDNTPYDFCIPGHRYLFKEAIKSAKDPSKPRHPDQYWCEVIAFQIGRLMQLQVPPVFVSVNSATGEPGSLCEWFIGYSPDIEERSTPGGEHMQKMIAGYDRDKGRQHNLTSIITFSRAMTISKQLTHSWKEYWGLCLCFDALIGNTDRHQENWKVIWNGNEGTARLSPFFDNGTSLGHELFPKKFNQCVRDNNMLLAYINRGRHQMKWHKDDEGRLPLIEGVSRYCRKYPEVVPLLIDRLQWEDDALFKILSELTTFHIQSPLTAERAAFIHKLTCYRKRLLLEELEMIGNEAY
ncbi:hypothetical protein [Endozoicomonas sp. SCSIO W0465]|uniref:hypothetical protein n=1 Tax=Endozoicomonas sp. SCSIO W0465 TaxID=2918516 RepID=UPI0020764009|nr:hypothetical protein [Endozoicomonas sp. SCSIO W0465]USE38914.1 hypothetical protein MJO57_12540 [Endozoicomonas sp. SCSIO W0465]